MHKNGDKNTRTYNAKRHKTKRVFINHQVCVIQASIHFNSTSVIQANGFTNTHASIQPSTNKHAELQWQPRRNCYCKISCLCYTIS